MRLSCRPLLLFALALSTLLGVGPATAAPVKAFDRALMSAALHDGRPEVTAAVQALRDAGFLPEILRAAQLAQPDQGGQSGQSGTTTSTGSQEARIEEASLAWARRGEFLKHPGYEVVKPVVARMYQEKHNQGVRVVNVMAYCDGPSGRVKWDLFLRVAEDDYTILSWRTRR